MKRVAIPSIVSAVALCVACSPDAVTAPSIDEENPVNVTAANLNSGSDSSLDFSADLNFTVERVLPGFSDPVAREQLEGQIAQLNDHLAAGEREAALDVLTQARGGLTTEVSNRTDIGYIESVLSNIEQALNQ